MVRQALPGGAPMSRRAVHPSAPACSRCRGAGRECRRGRGPECPPLRRPPTCRVRPLLLCPGHRGRARRPQPETSPASDPPTRWWRPRRWRSPVVALPPSGSSTRAPDPVPDTTSARAAVAPASDEVVSVAALVVASDEVVESDAAVSTDAVDAARADRRGGVPGFGLARGRGDRRASVRCRIRRSRSTYGDGIRQPGTSGGRGAVPSPGGREMAETPDWPAPPSLHAKTPSSRRCRAVLRAYGPIPPAGPRGPR